MELLGAKAVLEQDGRGRVDAAGDRDVLRLGLERRVGLGLAGLEPAPAAELAGFAFVEDVAALVVFEVELSAWK